MVPVRRFNWIVLLAFLIFGIILWPFLIALAVAIVFYLVVKPKCPNCKTPLLKEQPIEQN